MKNLFILFVFAVLFINIHAQDVLWTKSLSSSEEVIPVRTITDSENNLYILGKFKSNLDYESGIFSSKGASDLFLGKFSSNGNLLWITQIGSDSNENPASIEIYNNSIYITGNFQDTCYFGTEVDSFLISQDLNDIFLAKYKLTNGSLTWKKRIAWGNGNQVAQGISFDYNGNIILCGFFFGEIIFETETLTDDNIVSSFFAQFDSLGNYNWSSNFEGNSLNFLYNVATKDSFYYAAGAFKDTLYYGSRRMISIKDGSGNFTNDIFLIKINDSGDFKWVRKLGGSANDFSVFANIDNDGNAYISGYYTSTDMQVDSTGTEISQTTPPNNGSNDLIFAKYSQDGTLQWYDHEGSTGDDKLTRLTTDNTSIVIAGQYAGPLEFRNEVVEPVGGTDGLGLVHDIDDNLIYMISMGGNGTDITRTAAIDNEGYYYFMGDFTSDTIFFGTDTMLINTNVGAGTKDMFIAKYDKMSLDFFVTDVSCNGGSDGAIDVTVEGIAEEPYNFAWQHGAATEDLTGLTAGWYKVTFTDNTGYQKVDSVYVGQADPIGITLVSTTDVSCNIANDGTINNGGIDIEPTGGVPGYSYVWSANSGSGLLATSQDQTTLTAGSYNVTVTDANGCEATLNNIAIDEPPAITVTVDSTHAASSEGATDGDIYITADGGTPGYTYSWSNGTSNEDLIDVAGGQYTVSVEDTKGCVEQKSAVVNEPDAIIITVDSSSNVNCTGGSSGNIYISITGGTGNYTSIDWNGPGGFTSNSEDITGLAAGTYTVDVADDGTGTGSHAVELTEPTSAVSVTITSDDVSCNGSSDGLADANPTGGTPPYNYAWTKVGDPTFSESSEVIYNLGEGNYQVDITDAKGCNASASKEISEPPVLSVTSAIKNVSCYDAKNDGEISLNVSGGASPYEFQWSNGRITSKITLLKAAEYCVTITDANGCEIYNCYTVEEPQPFVFQPSIDKPSCYGDADGSIAMEVTGGNAPYDFTWSTGLVENDKTISTISSLAKGSYWLDITDSKNCAASDTIIMTQPDSITISASDIKNVSCNGGSDGYIQININGGTTPYSDYFWTPDGQQTQNISGIDAGNYSVTVTDNSGCNKSKAFQVTEPQPLMLTEKTAEHVDLSCPDGSNGQLSVSPTGGSGAFEFSIDGSNWVEDSVFTGLTGGEYTITVRDANSTGCVYSLTPLTISAPDAIDISATISQHVTCNGENNGELTISATGGTPGFQYSIDSGKTFHASGVFADLAAATYDSITVLDAEGCTGIASVVIPEPLPLEIQVVQVNDATSMGGTDGSIETSASGGTSPYSFTLNAGEDENTTGTFTGLAAGTYLVAVTDANNCGPAETSQLEVSEPTGVEHAGIRNIRLYPNPASQQFTLELEARDGEDKFTLEITGISGNNLLVRKVEFTRNNIYKVNIDVSSYPAGVYIVRLNGIPIPERLVVE
jgi:hypothetical protein